MSVRLFVSIFLVALLATSLHAGHDLEKRLEDQKGKLEASLDRLSQETGRSEDWLERLGDDHTVITEAAKARGPHEGSYLVTGTSASRIDAGSGGTPDIRNQQRPPNDPGRPRLPKNLVGILGDRTRESGTQGLIGGPDHFDAPSRRKRSPGPRGAGEIGPQAGGREVEAPVQSDDRTRWERAKANLRDFVRAYVNGDLGGMLRVLSPDFTQDVGILQNAAQGDFKYLENRNVDIELLTYRMTFFTVAVELRWWVTGTDQQTGDAFRDEGRLSLLFDRLNDLKIQTFQGDSFVGQLGTYADDWQEQAGAGDPNAGSHSFDTITATLDDTPGQDHLLIDFETGNSTITGSLSSPQPPYDIVIGISSGEPNGLYYIAESWAGPFGINFVGECAPTSATGIQDVSDGPTLNVTASLTPPNLFVIAGAETDGGGYALFDVQGTKAPTFPSANPNEATITVRYIFRSGGANRTDVGPGTIDCP